jgi:aryl-alcohol dehydrogenase-like predicted oxidoreductase
MGFIGIMISCVMPDTVSTQKLILGTVQLGTQYGINNAVGQPDKSVAMAMLDCAFEQGIRVVDTAQAYGDSEKIIGEYHALNPEKLFAVITKFHAEKDNSDASIIDSAYRSLDLLKISTFECFQFHRVSDVFQSSDVTKSVLYLKKHGVAKNIGVSVYTNEEFDAVSVVPEIDVIQIPFNLLDNQMHRGALIQKARNSGKTIHSRSIYLQGALLMSPNSLPWYLTSLRDPLARLSRIAQDFHISMSEMAMRYVFHAKNIDAVLFGAESVAQILENCSIASKESLPKDICEQIEAITIDDKRVLNPSLWQEIAIQDNASLSQG